VVLHEIANLDPSGFQGSIPCGGVLFLLSDNLIQKFINLNYQVISMNDKMLELPLSARVRNYYESQELGDGRGGRLTAKTIAELSDTVVAVQDSLGDFDIFFDVNCWEVVDSAESPYRLFVVGVKENADKNASLGEKYQMTVIAESVWNPLYGRSRASFIAARDAAKAYLKPINDNEENMYSLPKII
jgi:hypothetical protein